MFVTLLFDYVTVAGMEWILVRKKGIKHLQKKR